MPASAAVVSRLNDPVLGRPSLLRRGLPLAVIIALHIGFFMLLRSSLLQQVRTSQPVSVVMAILYPPAPPPLPVVPATAPELPIPATPPPPPPKKSVPVKRPATKPRPVAPEPPAAMPSRDIVSDVAAPVAVITPPAAAPVPESTPAPTAPTPAPAAPPAPGPPKIISSGVQYLQPPRPDYPAQSKRLGEEGRVVLRVLIDEQGRAGRIEVQTSSGFPRLDDAAREAVQRARFRPHLENGQPTPVYAVVPISFKLDQ